MRRLFVLLSATRRSGHPACWILSHVRWTIGYQLPVDQCRLTVSKGVWVSYRTGEAGELYVSFSKILPLSICKAEKVKKRKKKRRIFFFRYSNHIGRNIIKDIFDFFSCLKAHQKPRTYVISRRKIGRRRLRMKSVFIQGIGNIVSSTRAIYRD